MQKRIDLPRPILEAFIDVDHIAIVKGKADVKSGGVLASKLPKRLSQFCRIQAIDRQWRSLLVNDDVKNGGWEAKTTHECWQAMTDRGVQGTCDLYARSDSATPEHGGGRENKVEKCLGC